MDSPISEATVYMMAHLIEAGVEKNGQLKSAVLDRLSEEIGLRREFMNSMISMSMACLQFAMTNSESPTDEADCSEISRWVLESAALSGGVKFNRGFNWGWERYRAVVMGTFDVSPQDERNVAKTLRVGQFGSVSERYLDAGRCQCVDLLGGLRNDFQIVEIVNPDEYVPYLAIQSLDSRPLRGPIGFTILPTMFRRSHMDLN